MKEITLTHGKTALVDDADFEHLSQFKWHAAKEGNIWYAVRTASRREGRSSVRMHRLIIGAKPGTRVDHMDCNGLNNQRHNLRLCTHQQNLCNRPATNANTSGFKGVSWYKRYQKWEANIAVNGKKRRIGYFDSLVKAACAYDDAARELHGEFARVNFPRWHGGTP
jgi:hypothetical protein